MGTWETGAIEVFVKATAVISCNKNRKNRLKILQFTRKTTAAPCQCGDIMAQISIDALNSEGVIFVVNIENMLSGEDDIQITRVPIRTIVFCLRCCIYHLLNGPGGLVAAHNMAQDLPQFPAYHRHDVDIFPGFCAGLALQKPIQLIQFHNFGPGCGIFFIPLGLNGLFLSNSSHWICSSSGFFLLPGRWCRHNTF